MARVLPFNSTLLKDVFTPCFPDQPVSSDCAYWLVLQAHTLVVRCAPEQQLLYGAGLPDSLPTVDAPVLIGLWRDCPLYAVQIAADAVIPQEYETLPFQGIDMRLDDVLASIAGRAAQILHWLRRSRFCSHCGAALVPLAASWGKQCTVCQEVHFPHIHPCIIVLVRNAAQLLMIRNSTWAAGRFSLVAGFLDFGESLEECVQREVREETGIEIENIVYVGSQCWPFPSQLMVGFTADYRGGDINPDGVEVVEAGWFHEDELPTLPGSRRSIARWIFENYGNSGR